jgi:hypothetical protein
MTTSFSASRLPPCLLLPAVYRAPQFLDSRLVLRSSSLFLPIPIDFWHRRKGLNQHRWAASPELFRRSCFARAADSSEKQGMRKKRRILVLMASSSTARRCRQAGRRQPAGLADRPLQVARDEAACVDGKAAHTSRAAHHGRVRGRTGRHARLADGHVHAWRKRRRALCTMHHKVSIPWLWALASFN